MPHVPRCDLAPGRGSGRFLTRCVLRLIVMPLDSAVVLIQ
jgi:hypothetical protein